MPYLPSKPDFLLDRTLAKITTNERLTDEQIDHLVAICEPPTEQLRDIIAVEFERAALVLKSGQAVVGSRAKLRAFQDKIYAAQRYAKKLSYLITNLDPELKMGLNSEFEAAQKRNDYLAALPDMEYLLDAFVEVALPYPPGTKFDDVLDWVVDGLIHAIDTRLTPAFNCYSPRKRGKWFSNVRQAKLISAFLTTVEPEKSKRYSLDYISYRVKHGNLVIAARKS